MQKWGLNTYTVKAQTRLKCIVFLQFQLFSDAGIGPEAASNRAAGFGPVNDTGIHLCVQN